MIDFVRLFLFLNFITIYENNAYGHQIMVLNTHSIHKLLFFDNGLGRKAQSLGKFPTMTLVIDVAIRGLNSINASAAVMPAIGYLSQFIYC